MNEIIIGLLIGILLLQFIAYYMNQIALRALNQKQQSTIYGVSHLWGSIIEPDFCIWSKHQKYFSLHILLQLFRSCMQYVFQDRC